MDANERELLIKIATFLKERAARGKKSIKKIFAFEKLLLMQGEKECGLDVVFIDFLGVGVCLGLYIFSFRVLNIKFIRMELSKCKSTQIYIAQCIDHRVYLNVHTFVYARLGTCINVLAYKLIYYVLVTVYLICMSNDADKKRRKKQRMSRPLKYAFNFGCQKSEWLRVLKFTFLRVYRVSTNASDLL